MVEALLRPRRRRPGGATAAAAAGYAALGWPICAGAGLVGGQHRADRQPRRGAGRACTCDRVGCPAPGAHPLSPAWKLEATANPSVVRGWWTARPQASILLATGRVFDVLDVPARAGKIALTTLAKSGATPGPVAIGAHERVLFFVTSRAAVADEHEWWSCHLDCEPESVPAVTGLRWHCRDSYVLAPPSRLSDGTTARWLVGPAAALPDPFRLLEVLADACEEIGQ
jgi:hypothetical protein